MTVKTTTTTVTTSTSKPVRYYLTSYHVKRCHQHHQRNFKRSED